MKRILSALLVLFAVTTLFAQSRFAAIINDPDGYTNVRKEASSSSPIVKRINVNKVFYAAAAAGNWYKVYDTKTGPQTGYMHKSRIVKLQPSHPFVINDPDGYTNVRKEASSSSPVLYRIEDGEVHNIITSSIGSKWLKVAGGGYIYYDRVFFLTEGY